MRIFLKIVLNNVWYFNCIVTSNYEIEPLVPSVH